MCEEYLRAFGLGRVRSSALFSPSIPHPAATPAQAPSCCLFFCSLHHLRGKPRSTRKQRQLNMITQYHKNVHTRTRPQCNHTRCSATRLAAKVCRRVWPQSLAAGCLLAFLSLLRRFLAGVRRFLADFRCFIAGFRRFLAVFRPLLLWFLAGHIFPKTPP